MNWKLTKTLFIFVFILVNIVLVSVYINKVNRSHINEVESDNEVNFQQEDIKVSNNILNKSVKGIHLEQITAHSEDFSDEAKDNSDLTTSDSGKTLESDIDPSVDVSDKNLKDIKDYLTKHVYKGENYQLSNITSDSLTYEQTYGKFPIMNNNKAQLKITVDNNKATKYRQALMNNIQPTEGADEKEQVITPRKAIEALYFNRYLQKNDEVVSARLGYYSVVKETNVQLLQPNWEVKIKHPGKDKVSTYYVEATRSNPKIIDH